MLNLFNPVQESNLAVLVVGHCTAPRPISLFLENVAPLRVLPLTSSCLSISQQICGKPSGRDRIRIFPIESLAVIPIAFRSPASFPGG